MTTASEQPGPRGRAEADGTAAGRLGPIARAFLLAGLLLAAFGALTFARGDADAAFEVTPFDLTINMVAAGRLVHRDPLYEADASRAEAVERGGPIMADAYHRPTDGFPGLPSTALLHVPFLVGSDGSGFAVFRWLDLVGMAGAIALVASTLPRGARLAGGVFGAGALLASVALIQTVTFGQGHGFVMLAFAAAIWGAATDRWRAVGIGLGFATALKLSPVLIVVYLAVRGRRQVLPWAAGVVAALAAGAAVVGRPGDLWTWAGEVAPSLSGGTDHFLNQSLPALADRVSSTSADLAAIGDLGAWRYLAPAIALVGVAALWRARRGRPVDPLEIGVLLLLGLVAGPLTWGHYATWAALPMVLIADPRRWAGRRPADAGLVGAGLAAAALLLTTLADRPDIAFLTGPAARRWTTSAPAVALVLLLVASAHLVGATDQPSSEAARSSPDRAASV